MESSTTVTDAYVKLDYVSIISAYKSINALTKGQSGTPACWVWTVFKI